MLWLPNNGKIFIILFAPSQRYTKCRILLWDLHNVVLLHVYLCICSGQCQLDHWRTGPHPEPVHWFRVIRSQRVFTSPLHNTATVEWGQPKFRVKRAKYNYCFPNTEGMVVKISAPLCACKHFHTDLQVHANLQSYTLPVPHLYRCPPLIVILTRMHNKIHAIQI